ncbi:MAG: hypothetical protein ACRD63_03340, partial [Pyrinomonadaceae bacterium]
MKTPDLIMIRGDGDFAVRQDTITIHQQELDPRGSLVQLGSNHRFRLFNIEEFNRSQLPTTALRC